MTAAARYGRAMSDARSHTHTFTAADGTSLVSDVYTPAGPPVGAVLLGPAMGVRRRYYGPFAQYLAERGLLVLVPDYRGIGAARGSRARLHEWGALDLTAGAREVQLLAPGLPLLFLGHSVGGQLFGLIEAPFVAAQFVASQSGHWRLWSGAPKLGMAALWWVGIPLLTRLTGRLPMAALGQGEDLPPLVARDWARWGRDRDYLEAHARTVGGARYVTFDGPIRAVAIEDDAYAPPRTVQALCRHYPRARFEPVLTRPKELGVRTIGHFGWFRERFREALWAPSADWLLERTK